METRFVNKEHKSFYEECVSKTNSQKDSERKALFYTLGLTAETRKNINALYNFESQCIEWDGLKKAFQTGTTIRVCRLAFNLYNNLHGQHDESERAVNYTPSELFYTDLMEYMFEAVRIRYPNLAREWGHEGY